MSSDGLVVVKFLSPNVTAVTQPMDGEIVSVKQRNWADLLRTPFAEDDSIIGLWKEVTVLDAIYGVSWAWSSVNPVTLVRSWGKLLPDLEEDVLQCFPNEEISKSEILDMVFGVRSFENVDKDNIEEWLLSDACELGLLY
jgi:hypothetical protein